MHTYIHTYIEQPSTPDVSMLSCLFKCIFSVYNYIMTVNQNDYQCRIELRLPLTKLNFCLLHCTKV